MHAPYPIPRSYESQKLLPQLFPRATTSMQSSQADKRQAYHAAARPTEVLILLGILTRRSILEQVVEPVVVLCCRRLCGLHDRTRTLHSAVEAHACLALYAAIWA